MFVSFTAPYGCTDTGRHGEHESAGVKTAEFSNAQLRIEQKGKNKNW